MSFGQNIVHPFLGEVDSHLPADQDMLDRHDWNSAKNSSKQLAANSQEVLTLIQQFLATRGEIES